MVAASLTPRGCARIKLMKKKRPGLAKASTAPFASSSALVFLSEIQVDALSKFSSSASPYLSYCSKWTLSATSALPSSGVVGALERLRSKRLDARIFAAIRLVFELRDISRVIFHHVLR